VDDWNLLLFFSALLDNLAAAIVLIAILRKLVPDKTDRMKYASIIILAANAGGSWSPIGDVTTLLLWTGGNITAMNQITRLFLPAFVNLLTVLVISHFWLFRKGTVLRQNRDLSADEIYIEKIPERSRIVIFWIGIFSLALVPVFQSLTHLPAFMCVMLGLALLWVYTDLTYGRVSEIVDADKLRVPVLSRAVDLPTIFSFWHPDVRCRNECKWSAIAVFRLPYIVDFRTLSVECDHRCGFGIGR